MQAGNFTLLFTYKGKQYKALASIFKPVENRGYQIHVSPWPDKKNSDTFNYFEKEGDLFFYQYNVDDPTFQKKDRERFSNLQGMAEAIKQELIKKYL